MEPNIIVKNVKKRFQKGTITEQKRTVLKHSTITNNLSTRFSNPSITRFYKNNLRFKKTF